MALSRPVRTFSNALATEFDDILMDNLDQGSLYRLSWTSKELYERVNSYMKRRMTINSLLGRFLSESEWFPFRSMQRHYGFVISGSAALHFLSRAKGWVPGDLDVYIQHEYAIYLIKWLANIGFQYRPSIYHPELDTIKRALAYRDKASLKHGMSGYSFNAAVLDMVRNDRKIQVIATRTSIISTVIDFHTTAVMNVITYNMAYCFYPVATLSRNISLLRCNLPLSQFRMAAIKYHERGWDMAVAYPVAPAGLDTVSFRRCLNSLLSATNIRYRNDSTEPFTKFSVRKLTDTKVLFKDGVRRVGDSKCWSYPLPSLQENEGTATRLIEANTWLNIHNGVNNVYFRAGSIKSFGLAYMYAYATKSLRDDVQELCDGFLWRMCPGKKDAYMHNKVLYLLKRDEGMRYFNELRQVVTTNERARASQENRA